MNLNKGWALSGLHADVMAISQYILSSLYQLTLADSQSGLHTEYRELQNDIKGDCGDCVPYSDDHFNDWRC